MLTTKPARDLAIGEVFLFCFVADSGYSGLWPWVRVTAPTDPMTSEPDLVWGRPLTKPPWFDGPLEECPFGPDQEVVA